MSREIIFRVWDSKKFIYTLLPTRIMYDSGGHPYIPFYLTDYPEIDFNFKIQQYTRLKDKNGKDIYEGDILKCKGHDDWFDEKGFFYNLKVEYKIVESGDSEISGYTYIPKDREVIGNIFENPELLK